MEKQSGQDGVLNPAKRLGKDFFTRDALDLAPGLLGKNLVIVRSDVPEAFRITETEAYCGEEDLASHASKGRTRRTEVMYGEGGYLYMYLIYGMYWMLNIVAGQENSPQAVLIRGVERYPGPGRLTKGLQLDGGFYGESLVDSPRIWISEGPAPKHFLTTPRIGVDYAGEWKDRLWRFVWKEG